MKSQLSLLATIIFFALSCSGQKTDSELITEVYAKYQIGISEKNVEKMIPCISQETITYYNNIVEMAKFSDSVHISTQTPIDKTLILYLRHTMTSDLLAKYTGKEFMYFTLSKGIHVEDELPKTKLSEIKVNGNEAIAQFSVNGMNTEEKIKFRKENGIWKIDVSSTYSLAANDLFKQHIMQSGLSENEFIKYMVLNMAGSEIEMDDSIWHKRIK